MLFFKMGGTRIEIIKNVTEEQVNQTKVVTVPQSVNFDLGLKKTKNDAQ